MERTPSIDNEPISRLGHHVYKYGVGDITCLRVDRPRKISDEFGYYQPIYLTCIVAITWLPVK